MPTAEEIGVKFYGDADEVEEAADDAAAAVKKAKDKMERDLQEVAGLFTSVGQRMTIGLTLPILAFGGASLKASNDLTEAKNKALVTFGAWSRTIEDFAADSADAFGISKQAAFEYSATLGNILQASKLSKEASAEMSAELLELAADLASFNNLSIDDALLKLQAGLVGEVEPLRRVGVLLSETAVKAKAAELGFQEVNGVLSEAAKVQARYALILDQTKNAQGDFARTADELANMGRRASATFEDLRAEVGETLKPIAKDILSIVVPALKDFTKWWQSLSDSQKKSIVVIGGVVAAIGPLFMLIGGGINQILALSKGLASLKALFAAAGGGAGILKAALGLLTGPIGIIIAAVTALFLAWKNNWGGMRDVVNQIVGEIGQLLGDIIAEVKSWVEELGLDWDTFLAAIKQAWAETWNDIWEQVGRVLKLVWSVIKNVLTQVIDAFGTFIRVIKAIIEGDWRKAGELLVQFWERSWNRLKAIVTRAAAAVLGTIYNAVKGINNAIKALGGQGFDLSGFKDLIDGMGILADEFEEKARLTKGTAIDLSKTLKNAMQDLPTDVVEDTGGGGGAKTGGAKATTKAVKETEKALTDAQKATQALAQQVLGLRREQELWNDSTREAATRWDLQNTELKKAHPILKAMAIAYSRALDQMAAADEAKAKSDAEADAARERMKARVEEITNAWKGYSVQAQLAAAKTDDERLAIELMNSGLMTGIALIDAITFALAKKARQAEKDAAEKTRLDEVNSSAEKYLETLRQEYDLAQLKTEVERDLYRFRHSSYQEADQAVKDAIENQIRLNAEQKRSKSFLSHMKKINEEMIRLSLGTHEAQVEILMLTEEMTRAEAEAVVAAGERLERLEQTRETIKKLTDDFVDFVMQTLETLYEDGFSKFFQNVIAGFRAMLMRIAQEYLRSYLFKILLNFGEGLMGGLTRQVSNVTNVAGDMSSGAGGQTMVSHFAEGGRFFPGQYAMVGEQGPELVRFDRAGEVVNNRDTRNTLEREGAGDTYYITIPVSGVKSPEEFIRSTPQIIGKMEDALDRKRRRG